MAQTGTAKNGKKLQCAILLAEGDKTVTEIAKDSDVPRRTLCRWLTEPDFQDLIQEIRSKNAERLRGEGLRRKENRIAAYEDMAKRIETIVRQRGEEMELICSGGSSGLMGRDYKQGFELYRFDAMLVREYRELNKQIAVELGQWTEKTEINDSRDIVPEINVFIEQQGQKES